DVPIQEGGGTNEGHCSTVLRLNSSQVAEVSPLDSFLSVGSRTRDVVAVFRSHFFHLTQSAVLFSDFFGQTDSLFQVYAVFQISLQRSRLRQFVFHQVVATVRRNATVVTDAPATAICTWRTARNTTCTATRDVRSVNVEDALAVSFTVFCEDFFDHRIQFAVVRFAG